MNKQAFSEAIKVKDGKFYNLTAHLERIDRTMHHFYGKAFSEILQEDIIPLDMKKGLVKCRIEYTDEILAIDFIPYTFRNIKSLMLVSNDSIDYTFKSTDRNAFTNLLKQSDEEEILIIKNGLVTDTSFSNVVFKDSTGLYTPSTFLLRGTKREELLQKGIVEERDIRKEDIYKYDCVYMVNAMIDLENEICIPVKAIKELTPEIKNKYERE